MGLGGIKLSTGIHNVTIPFHNSSEDTNNLIQTQQEFGQTVESAVEVQGSYRFTETGVGI